MNYGFSAATLVHTKEGLKPIEKIDAGDWVLSKHESGQGEQEYKRVTKTFTHPEGLLQKIGFAVLKGDKTYDYHRLFVTPEQPIWIQKKGWKNASKVLANKAPAHTLEVLSGLTAVIRSNLRLFKTKDSGVAWAPSAEAAGFLARHGEHYDVHKQSPIRHSVFIDFEYVIKTCRVKHEHLFSATIFNLEVEDFHTYYVGDVGVWVHNKCSSGKETKELGSS